MGGQQSLSMLEKLSDCGAQVSEAAAAEVITACAPAAASSSPSARAKEGRQPMKLATLAELRQERQNLGNLNGSSCLTGGEVCGEVETVRVCAEVQAARRDDTFIAELAGGGAVRQDPDQPSAFLYVDEGDEEVADEAPEEQQDASTAWRQLSETSGHKDCKEPVCI
eukprot:TRINITY_DN45629_c0_g1_i1.p1 TRINITY_DN45629_c0_g1~~TRINITY_DN45629_c0_g1_i1.p1  ORF type:complete len:167 (-),score=52.43 TRINITY_DN45629_c0_g1_i1:275-775(-)